MVKTFITHHYQPMSIPTKEQIIKALIDDYKDDLDFIEAVNNLTYQRKVTLKTNLNQRKNVNFQEG